MNTTLSKKKLTIIFVAIDLMKALTNYVSNLLKTFREHLSTEINDAISQKLMQNSKRNRSWLSLSQRTRLDFKSQNLPKNVPLLLLQQKLATLTYFEIE